MRMEMNKMKHLKQSFGIACFCISLTFGIYVLAFQDAPHSGISLNISISSSDSTTNIV